MFFFVFVIIGLFAGLDAEECFTGTDTLVSVPCEACKGLPIEVMLILDDSSSIRANFPKEINFAKTFVKNLTQVFGTVRVGATFFSECMAGPIPSWLSSMQVKNGVPEYRHNYPPGTADACPNCNLNCFLGSKESKFDLTDAGNITQILDTYSNTGHWGTPLSVGYDFAIELMNKSSTPGRMRVVVMISDGSPSRPDYVPGNPTGRLIPAWEKISRCDDNVTVLKNLGHTSMTITVGGLNTDASARNMDRWASFPRETWSLRVADEAALVAELTNIMDILCFYIISVTNSDPRGINCVQKNDTLMIVGKNLFDMVQDIVPISTTKIGNVYDLGDTFSISMIRVRSTSLSSAELQIKIGDCSSAGGWTTLPNWSLRNNPQFGTSANANGKWYVWELLFNAQRRATGVLYDASCVRLSDQTGIQEVEVYGKGATSQKPLCRFGINSGMGMVYYYSDARVVGIGQTNLHCEMPDTMGRYGYYTVEVNREGGVDGAFTSNNRKIRHTDSQCKSPLAPSPPTPLNTLPGGVTWSPTYNYFAPTPISSSPLEVHWNVYTFLFFLISSNVFSS